MTNYNPVSPDFLETLAKIPEGKNVKAFYFREDKLEEIAGPYSGTVKTDKGEFVQFSEGKTLRTDRIITIDGKPGPCYHEYEAYGNSCMDSCE